MSIASEKEAKEKLDKLDAKVEEIRLLHSRVQELRKELTFAKEPTIVNIIMALLEAAGKNMSNPYGKPTNLSVFLLDLYDRIMSLDDKQLQSETGFTDREGGTVLHTAAYYRFPRAALSRLTDCGCDIDEQ